MSKEDFSKTVNRLFNDCEWTKARTLIESALETDPENHWLLTQRGVTFYEERKYEKALPIFLASLKIVDDCPLTLWNLAGTLDALRKSTEAVKIYKWLLETNKSPAEDPCWETNEWADALKTDCVYRLGACFEKLGKKKSSERCYRQYLDLLLLGADGTYSIDDVTRRIRALQGHGKNGAVTAAVRNAIHSALPASLPSKPGQRRPKPPPRFDKKKLLTRRRTQRA